MPFLGVDSWRWQYFEGQPCPDGVVVPIDDATAWELHRDHRAIYNKLLICDSQGLPNGPSSVRTSPTEPTRVQVVTSGRGRASPVTPRVWSASVSARSRTRIFGLRITTRR